WHAMHWGRSPLLRPTCYSIFPGPFERGWVKQLDSRTQFVAASFGLRWAIDFLNHRVRKDELAVSELSEASHGARSVRRADDALSPLQLHLSGADAGAEHPGVQRASGAASSSTAPAAVGACGF